MIHFHSLEKDLPKQITHRDLHPANILFNDGKLTGIFDFEMVCIGIRIFDPCYCATSILVGGFQNPQNRCKWTGILRSVFHGYRELIDISVIEQQAIFPVLLGIQLLFMAFSLQQGEYTGSTMQPKRDELVMQP